MRHHHRYGCAFLRLALLTAVMLLPCLGYGTARADESTAALEAEFDAEYDNQPESFPDPLEPMNRKILNFNRGVDRWFLNPITDAYAFVVPEPAQVCVQQFL